MYKTGSNPHQICLRHKPFCIKTFYGFKNVFLYTEAVVLVKKRKFWKIVDTFKYYNF